MEILKGDYVTRKSYNNDTVFKVINIKDGIYYLKGVEVRLYADSDYNDLVKCEAPVEEDYSKDTRKSTIIEKDDYFYLPGKVLHIDGDSEYLDKCLKFYKYNGVYAIGKKIKEEEIYEQINLLLKEYKPDIVVITGHDSYNSRKDNNYQNTDNFINAVISARRYEKSQDKLLIIAGACQSNYEELIRAGANFASSPKRVNIHALDPAIVAVSLALSDRNKSIDLIEILKKTKYGSDGLGGIITNGTMYVGYPRWWLIR